MRLQLKLIVFGISVFLIQLKTIAQNNYTTKNTGYLNFNLQNSKLKHNSTQQISIYGCNTSITLNSKSINGPKGIKGPKGFTWNKNNQIVSGVPFGIQTDNDTKETFYISKYYIASPPIVNVIKNKKNKIFKNLEATISDTIYDIGLITPNEFIFNGEEKPVQLVYLDYSILKTMLIQYIDIEFDESFTKEVDNSLIKLIPFKVECKDFPWINTEKIKNGTGASGIGAFNRTITTVGKQPNRLFLPYYYNNEVKEYLDCEVTLLNDIILNYELFFIVDGKKEQTINLKKHFSKHKTQTVKIHVKKRKKLPCGCSKPKNKIKK